MLSLFPVDGKVVGNLLDDDYCALTRGGRRDRSLPGVSIASSFEGNGAAQAEDER